MVHFFLRFSPSRRTKIHACVDAMRGIIRSGCANERVDFKCGNNGCTVFRDGTVFIGGIKVAAWS